MNYDEFGMSFMIPLDLLKSPECALGSLTWRPMGNCHCARDEANDQPRPAGEDMLMAAMNWQKLPPPEKLLHSSFCCSFLFLALPCFPPSSADSAPPESPFPLASLACRGWRRWFQLMSEEADHDAQTSKTRTFVFEASCRWCHCMQRFQVNAKYKNIAGYQKLKAQHDLPHKHWFIKTTSREQLI